MLGEASGWGEEEFALVLNTVGLEAGYSIFVFWVAVELTATVILSMTAVEARASMFNIL
jgi:hypothetical protein